MPEAVGIVEIYGVPAALEVADVMVKGGQVEFVRFDNAYDGLISVVIRGSVSEVSAAMQSALGASASGSRGAIAGHHIVPCPDGNVEAVLPLLRRRNSQEEPWLID